MVLIPIVLGLTYVGGIWFQLLILVLGIGLGYELVKNLDVERAGILNLLVISTFVGCGLLAIQGQIGFSVLSVLIGAVVCRVASNVSNPKSIILIGGVLSGGAAVVALIALRSGGEIGLTAVVWLFCVVWVADSLAYFSGRLIGGPKLAPKISPNKTWAGFIGGLAGAALAGYILVRVFDLSAALPIVILSVVAAVVAQLGDLQESWAKRQLNVKDSGTLLPGHGGLWDRLDALIVVAAFALAVGLARGQENTVAYNLLFW